MLWYPIETLLQCSHFQTSMIVSHPPVRIQPPVWTTSMATTVPVPMAIQENIVKQVIQNSFTMPFTDFDYLEM